MCEREEWKCYKNGPQYISLRKILFLRLRAVELPARFPSAQWAAAATPAAAARRSPPATVAE